MVERVKPRALLINGSDASGAIRAVFASMPREDLAALLTMLQAPTPPRLRWLEPSPLPAHCRTIAAPVVRRAGPSEAKINMGGRSAAVCQRLAPNFAFCCCGLLDDGPQTPRSKSFSATPQP